MDFDTLMKIILVAGTIVSYGLMRFSMANVRLKYKDQRVGGKKR